jgi:hypothetical protein
MNEPCKPLPDELLDDLLAPLRAVTLPDEVHSANREAVHRALARRAQPLWWRRTVAVPVPVAITATVALVVTVAASLWPSLGLQRIEREAPRPTQAQFVGTSEAPDIGTDYAAGPTWSVTRSYILSLESLAKERVSLPPDTTEKRDDS